MPSPSRPLQVLAYSIVALAIAFELTVVWLMLHPQVPDDYRAYYIDHTTTCLNQPVSGDYVLGETVSFRSDGRNEARPSGSGAAGSARNYPMPAKLHASGGKWPAPAACSSAQG